MLANSTMLGVASSTCLGVRPRASRPIEMLRSPERFLLSAPPTPSSEAVPSVKTDPSEGGIRPAIAFIRVLLPDPLWPIRPMDSPWLATNDTPRTAWTMSTAPICASFCAKPGALAPSGRRRTPYVLYFTCTLSAISVGLDPVLGRTVLMVVSATAVPRLRAPEEDEPEPEHQGGPPDCPQPGDGTDVHLSEQGRSRQLDVDREGLIAQQGAQQA